jgi:hypothetical protein
LFLLPSVEIGRTEPSRAPPPLAKIRLVHCVVGQIIASTAAPPTQLNLQKKSHPQPSLPLPVIFSFPVCNSFRHSRPPQTKLHLYAPSIPNRPHPWLHHLPGFNRKPTPSRYHSYGARDFKSHGCQCQCVIVR